MRETPYSWPLRCLRALIWPWAVGWLYISGRDKGLSHKAAWIWAEAKFYVWVWYG